MQQQLNSLIIICNGDTINHTWDNFIEVKYPTGTLTCYKDGKVEYRDIKGNYHRNDGPAIIFPDKSHKYYQHGVEISSSSLKKSQQMVTLSYEELDYVRRKGVIPHNVIDRELK